jgi:serine/threonine protein kinase
VVYTWAILRHMAIGIARGMQHLHAIGAIHRDVKSPNVIVRCGCWLRGGMSSASDATTGGRWIAHGIRKYATTVWRD